MPSQAFTSKTIVLPPVAGGIKDPAVTATLTSLIQSVQNGFGRFVAESPNPIPFMYIGANAVSPLTLPSGLVAIYAAPAPSQGADFIVNLPAATGSGALIGVKKSAASPHNVVINPIGGTLDGSANSLTLFRTNQAVILIDCIANTWNVFADYVPLGPLFAQTANVTVGNSAAEATILGAGVGSLVLPANYFAAGTVLRIEGWGFFSSLPSETFRHRLYLNASVLLDTGASILSNNQISGNWHLSLMLACQSAGAGGTIAGQGSVQYGLPFSMSGGGYEAYLPMTVLASVNTTIPQTVNLTFQWGAMDASSFTATNITVGA